MGMCLVPVPMCGLAAAYAGCDFLDLSWICLECLRVLCLGCVLGVSWMCLGCVLDASWMCLGCVLDASWMSWMRIECVLNASCMCFGCPSVLCPGSVLDMSSKCPDSVLVQDTSRTRCQSWWIHPRLPHPRPHHVAPPPAPTPHPHKLQYHNNLERHMHTW